MDMFTKSWATVTLPPEIRIEFGLDSRRNGIARQAEVLAWGIRAAREEGDVANAVHLRDHRAHAQTEAKEIEERLHDVAEHALGGELSPDEIVAAPHRDPRAAEIRGDEEVTRHRASPGPST